MIAQDNHLEKVFTEAPLIAFKRQSNIRERLIKAKVAPERGLREKRKFNGMKKVGNVLCVVMSEKEMK